jgi:hypothetical protein
MSLNISSLTLEWLSHLDRMELTYSTPDWDPGVTRYSVLEQQLQEDHTMLSKTGDRNPPTSIRRLDTRLDVVESGVTHLYYEHEASQSSAISASINPMMCDDWLANALQEHCCVSTLQTTTKSIGISADTLAKNWNIPLERAERTLQVTTQRGIKSRPTIMTQRFKTNDRMLRYQRLGVNMFTDTMEAGTLSKRQNKHAQVFVVPPNWTKVYAMRTKGEARHCLGSLFHEVGVPEKMIMDGSKEQTQGKFKKKLRDAGFIVHQTEPYTPWSDRAELANRELKRKTRRSMIASHCPKRLWDDCLEPTFQGLVAITLLIT